MNFRVLGNFSGFARHLDTSPGQFDFRSIALLHETTLLDEHDQRAIIRGLRDGHRDAWTALYDGYSSDVWRYAARLVGGQSNDVADVVQETFLAAARAARQFDASRGSLWSWLAGITHHQAASHWRRTGKSERLRALAEAGTIDLRQWWDGAEPADEIFERHELAKLVRVVLAELSSEYATMLTAKYLDEQSLEQMAGQFGSSVDAIKSKLARARRDFREKFESLTREPMPTVRAVPDAQA